MRFVCHGFRPEDKRGPKGSQPLTGSTAAVARKHACMGVSRVLHVATRETAHVAVGEPFGLGRWATRRKGLCMSCVHMYIHVHVLLWLCGSYAGLRNKCSTRATTSSPLRMAAATTQSGVEKAGADGQSVHCQCRCYDAVVSWRRGLPIACSDAKHPAAAADVLEAELLSHGLPARTSHTHSPFGQRKARGWAHRRACCLWCRRAAGALDPPLHGTTVACAVVQAPIHSFSALSCALITLMLHAQLSKRPGICLQRPPHTQDPQCGRPDGRPCPQV